MWSRVKKSIPFEPARRLSESVILASEANVMMSTIYEDVLRGLKKLKCFATDVLWIYSKQLFNEAFSKSHFFLFYFLI